MPKATTVPNGAIFFKLNMQSYVKEKLIMNIFSIISETISSLTSTDPLQLEHQVRSLAINYFWHISNKTSVQVFDEVMPGNKIINLKTPTLFRGNGSIRIGQNVIFGYVFSPGSFSCSYIESRNSESFIEIGSNTHINNQATIISEGGKIFIGQRCFIGTELMLFDSNFHRLELGQRHLPDHLPLTTIIEDDVFIGSRVTILKGAKIGHASVISAGAVVPPEFKAPPFSIIAGNPAIIIGSIPQSKF